MENKKDFSPVEFGFSHEELDQIKKLPVIKMQDGDGNIAFYREDILKKLLWEFCVQRLDDIQRASKNERGVIDFESLQKGYKILSDLNRELKQRLEEKQYELK